MQDPTLGPAGDHRSLLCWPCGGLNPVWGDIKSLFPLPLSPFRALSTAALFLGTLGRRRLVHAPARSFPSSISLRLVNIPCMRTIFRYESLALGYSIPGPNKKWWFPGCMRPSSPVLGSSVGNDLSIARCHLVFQLTPTVGHNIIFPLWSAVCRLATLSTDLHGLLVRHYPVSRRSYCQLGPKFSLVRGAIKPGLPCLWKKARSYTMSVTSQSRTSFKNCTAIPSSSKLFKVVAVV